MRLSPLVLAALLGLAAGCVGELTPLEADDTGGGGGGPDAGSSGVGSAAGRQFFAANLEPMWIASRPKGVCAGCHQGTNAVDGPDFLGATTTTHYDTLVVNSLLVGTTPENSVLIIKGDHEGNAFCTGTDTPYAGCTSDEQTLVQQWILLEASH